MSGGQSAACRLVRWRYTIRFMDAANGTTLNLSILQPDPAPDCGGAVRFPPESGLLTLQQGAFVGRKFQAQLTVCQDPFCACASVQFRCARVDEGASSESSEPTREFWIEVLDRRAITSRDAQRKDAESIRLAQAITSELTDSDWRELFRWFRFMKAYAIQTCPVHEIDTSNLPYVDPGELVGFAEVFPWGCPLEFPLEGVLWTVDELYCVEPRCTCKEAMLLFLRNSEVPGKVLTKPPALMYNYKTRAVSVPGVWPANAPSKTVLVQALEQATPSLRLQLEMRHTILKALYLRRQAAHLRGKIAEIEESIDSMATLPARALKIGRNEPCPCGSGKKYKYCCLGKGT